MIPQEATELDSVHHVAVNVADVQAAINWYTTSFNCRVVYQGKTRAVLQFENISITLVLPSQERPHIAFLRDDAASLGELRERPEGVRSTYISDPTGNIVELGERT